MKIFDVHGGYSGLVLKDEGITEDKLREEFEIFLRVADRGLKFNIECRELE